MLGKKKKKQDNRTSSAEQPKVSGFRYDVMPADFFGGKDPQIHYDKADVAPPEKKPRETVLPSKTKESPKVSAPAPVKPPERPIQKPAPPAVPPKVTLPKQKPKRHGAIMIIVIIVLAAFVGVLVWWFFFRDSTPVTPTSEPVPNRVDRPVSEPTREPTRTEPIIPEEPAVPPSPRLSRITLPRQNFVRSSDVDADGLSDSEEQLLGTDPSVWDTDDDGFYDGQEVFNLYNPLGFAPVRLISSGIVTEYLNRTLRYRIYHPESWQAALVDDNEDYLIVSAPNGEYIELRRFDLAPATTFALWFADRVEGESYAELTPITNHFGIEGFVRRDGLVVYFLDGASVFMFVYHSATGSETLEYRNIMAMLYQSFRIGNVAELTEQEARDRLTELRERDIIITRPPDEVDGAVPLDSSSVVPDGSEDQDTLEEEAATQTNAG